MAKTRKIPKKGKSKKDMITLNLDGKKEKKEKGDKELEESGHDCEEVHPDEPHEEWENKNVEEVEEVEEAMSAAEYRKKGIYVTDANHPGKGEEEDEDEDKPKKDGLDQGEQGKFNEDTNLTHFIKNVTEKNYSEANKYLQAALEQKMKGRIDELAQKIGF